MSLFSPELPPNEPTWKMPMPEPQVTNWSSWIEISKLMSTAEVLVKVVVPGHEWSFRFSDKMMSSAAFSDRFPIGELIEGVRVDERNTLITELVEGVEKMKQVNNQVIYSYNAALNYVTILLNSKITLKENPYPVKPYPIKDKDGNVIGYEQV